MTQLTRFFSRFLPIIVGLVALAMYWPGIAPGLSWANDGADGGDFITAVATGGVPHPSGYPAYILVARLFQLLPFGNLAWRTNLMSAVFMALAVALVFMLVQNRFKGNETGWFPALIAALAFGFAPLVWSQALITEVYGLHAFFVTLVFFQAFSNADSPSPVFSNPVRGLTFGLALGNHLTILFFAPLLLLPAAFEKRSRWAGIAERLVWTALGGLVYIVLPLRAMNGSPVNWGNPDSLGRFLWLVSGTLYRGYLFNFDLAELPLRSLDWLKTFFNQFGLTGLVLGLFGALAVNQQMRLRLVNLWSVLGLGFLSIAYGSRDSSVYLIPACLSFSIWLGMGLEQVFLFVQQKLPRAAGWLRVAAIVLLFARAVSVFPQVDASRDERAEVFGQEFSETLPPNAIAQAEEDPETFALWYFHYALGKRPDIAVVVHGLLPFDWYRATLRQTYPALSVPEIAPEDEWSDALKQANLARPFCSVAVYSRTVIICE